MRAAKPRPAATPETAVQASAPAATPEAAVSTETSGVPPTAASVRTPSDNVVTPTSAAIPPRLGGNPNRTGLSPDDSTLDISWRQRKGEYDIVLVWHESGLSATGKRDAQQLVRENLSHE